MKTMQLNPRLALATSALEGCIRQTRTSPQAQRRYCRPHQPTLEQSSRRSAFNPSGVRYSERQNSTPTNVGVGEASFVTPIYRRID